MKLFRNIVIGLFLAQMLTTLISCTINLTEMRFSPHYTGVDPKIKPYEDRWMFLAGDKKLKFKNEITIGFTDIQDGAVVGRCYYSMGFREIDVDNGYWRNSDTIEKTILVWHELTHCYCDRGHDYADGKDYTYPDDQKKEGFFPDKCPLSIMYPQIMDNTCFVNHFQDYVDEMFSRCNPY